MEDALDTLSMYVTDFQVEMQNLLLADLFGHKADHRKPIDPRKFVVRLDQRDALMQRFQDDTDWGRLEQASNENVRRRLAAAIASTASENVPVSQSPEGGTPST